ncbi:hypothetical protein QYE76_063374 [Lolium multiflorum]|uniref:F-box domain-containing protein n=1 Tax=Lolium multiflorum TaxID=4521 RepID=A0AAD8S4T5_LOLMU|nr:hypothetical protein QYE76_063374 [Lolium multiflorum]
MRLDIMYSCLPASPISAAAFLSAAISDEDGVEDRISALPNGLLRDVVSRLPVKDAARTNALCRRWRGLWRAIPLVLDDAHLITEGPGVDWRAPAAAAVSRVLASHPGPFRCVRLLSNLIDESNKECLAEWLRLIADKGVEDLTLVNRPWGFGVPARLPPSLLSCGASLRRLYLGVWFFPFTTGLPRSPDVFPHLRELGICHGIMQESDLAGELCSGVTKVSPDAVVPSIKVLALKVRFRVVEESDNHTDHYDHPGEVKARDKLNSTFWQGVGPIKCVQSRVKKAVFDQFCGGTNQVGFLKMVLGRAVLLQKVIVLLADQDPITVSEATRKLKPLASKRMWANKTLSKISLEVLAFGLPCAIWKVLVWFSTSFNVAGFSPISTFIPAKRYVLILQLFHLLLEKMLWPAVACTCNS